MDISLMTQSKDGPVRTSGICLDCAATNFVAIRFVRIQLHEMLAVSKVSPNLAPPPGPMAWPKVD